jgi:cytochrome P450
VSTSAVAPVAQPAGADVQPPAFPFPKGSSYQGPDPAFAELRAKCPVARVETEDGGHAWLVTRHADVLAALADARLSREAVYAPGAPSFAGLFQAPPGMIISLDPPRHTRLRALAAQGFSSARIEAMRPRIREVAAGLLDALVQAGADGSPVDLVGGFAAPLAMAVICELLGVPQEDRAAFLDWVRRFADVSGPAEDAIEARESLGAYMAGLVAGKTAEPADDVLSALIQAEDGGDRLGFEELVGLGYTLLGGGFDSAAGQIGNFALTLIAHHPADWRRFGEQPELIPAAVEELLRTVNLTASDTSGLPRVATADVEIGGTTIPAGDAVFFAFASANLDESVFPDPRRRDFARAENPHLAFGHGIHRCLGEPLARVELVVALEELTRRLPAARLAVPEAGLRWRTGDVNHNLAELPVLITPAPGADA